jgi:hypothetical protein
LSIENKGTVEIGKEILLIHIFFFPLHYGRKIYISVSRIHFTEFAVSALSIEKSGL